MTYCKSICIIFDEKGGEHVCAKMGRPKLEHPKSTQLTVRMDDETVAKLDEVAKEKSVTRTDVLRQGIEIQYERIKK